MMINALRVAAGESNRGTTSRWMMGKGSLSSWQKWKPEAGKDPAN